MIKQPEIYHKCPNCELKVTDLEFKSARHDYYCPRCNIKKLSSFEIVNKND